MATLDYSRVIDAGPGWTRVQLRDGRVITMRGDRAMRNNNPGNIEYGNFTRGQGAIGTDNRFAVFPSRQSGMQAQSNLIFESPGYRNLTLREAINRYAPPFENNTTAYANAVANAAGVTLDTRMSNVPRDRRQAVLAGMHAVEGNTSARGYDAVGNHIFTTDAVSPATPQFGPAVPRQLSGYTDLPRQFSGGPLNIGGKTPEQTFAAPRGLVERAPLGPASLRPDRPMPSGLLPGASQPDFIRPMPTGPVKPSPARVNPVDQKTLAAYREYAQLRGLAPAVPTPTAVMRPPDPALDVPGAGQPPATPPVQQPVTPPLQAPIVRQIQPRGYEAPSAPSLPSDYLGNTWQDTPQGRAVTNRFGVTTMQRPDGTTAAMGGPFASLDTSKFGSMAKAGLGGGLGAMLGGSLAGPIGGLVGGAIGREMAGGNRPMTGGGSGGLGGLLGGLFGGNRDPWSSTRESSNRATSQSSGSSRSSTSSGSKRDTRDRPDYR